MAIKITTNESILLETKGCKCEEDVEIIVEGNTVPVWDKKISDYVEPELITFTIDGTSYPAEPNMLWEQWVNSSYNTGEFDFSGAWVYSVQKISSGYYVYNTANNAVVGKTGIEAYSTNYELNIISNGVYKTKFLSFSGGSGN
jgi:hypothetical protein